MSHSKPELGVVMRSRIHVLLLALTISVAAASTLEAQGKSKGHKEKGPPPGQVKKTVTVDEGIRSARVVLGEQGYTVSRVEQVGGVRTIYYYRGNNGRGRGHGPLQKIVIRPYAQRVVVEGGVPSLVTLIRTRLGL